jgi:pimeloyl-ACP methyl ester carboxylesterase
MGGAVALTLAANHPERVRRLVLVAPAGLRAISPAVSRTLGRFAARAIPVRRAGAPLADLAWGRRLLMSPGTAEPASLPPAEVRAMLAASRGATRIAAALSSVAAADVRPLLAALELPVGAIWGERDRIIPPAGLDTVRALRPEAPVTLIPRAGHIPMMERPETFVAALDDQMSQLGNIGAAPTA